MTRIFRRSALKERLLATLEFHGGEYRGIYGLAQEVEHDTRHVRASLRLLADEGEVSITPGAPGSRNATIIKVIQ
jgi:predicted transcriptional regulator